MIQFTYTSLDKNQKSQVVVGLYSSSPVFRELMILGMALPSSIMKLTKMFLHYKAIGWMFYQTWSDMHIHTHEEYPLTIGGWAILLDILKLIVLKIVFRIS